MILIWAVLGALVVSLIGCLVGLVLVLQGNAELRRLHRQLVALQDTLATIEGMEPPCPR